ncbi:MAG: class I SAM-dependent methyltransferase, partial [Rhodobacteraceae bacterium]|nr:class I SAM-dependent methyltransferase [Paracoccaceae bacterium]
CGYGLADLLIHRSTGAELVLIDIEANDQRHFGFRDEGAAYADLAKARAFLEANGVDSAAITTRNLRHESLTDLRKVQLAVSFLSCGFHYPVSTYADFFEQQVTKSGAVILDLRERFDELAALARFGRITILDDSRRNSALVLMEK